MRNLSNIQMHVSMCVCVGVYMSLGMYACAHICICAFAHIYLHTVFIVQAVHS